MNTLDIILLLLFIQGVIRGLAKGLMEQAVSLAGIALGAWLAYKYYTEVGAWLGGFWQLSETVLNILGFAIILLLAFAIVMLVAKLITKIIEMASLGWINRVLGLVLSLFVTALTMGLLIMVFEALNGQFGFVTDSKLLEESVVYPLLKDFAQTVLPFLKQIITPAAEAIENAAEAVTAMV